MNPHMLSLSEIKKRIKSSFISLISRQIALRAIGFISINIILVRLLPIETIGIFNIANSIMIFFAFFADVGLGASLIQKKDKVEHADIKTTFTIQQILVILVSLIIILGAPFYAQMYDLKGDSVWLIRALGLSFFLTSLKVIPSVLLERELKFQPLVFAEVIENLIFNGLLIFLVIEGFGIWGFSIAAVVRSLAGVIVIYALAPIKLGIGIDKIAAKSILSFGIPFQLNSVLALLKDRLVPLVVAGLVGPASMTYITWSQSMAFLPLEVMNVVVRIMFPAFSRLQDDHTSLARAVEKSLFATALLVYPAIFGLGAILPFVVQFITTSKVEPAITSFYLFAVSTYWAVISTTFTNVLNAIGRIKTTLKLMVMWTIATWVLTPLMVLNFGFLGVGIASFLISFSSVITIVLVKRVLDVQILKAISLPTICSVLMAVVVYYFSLNFVHNAWSLIPAILLGAVVYTGLILLLGRRRILEEIKNLKQ